MDDLMTGPARWIEVLGPNGYVQAAVLVFLFLLLAKVIEVVLCGMASRLVANRTTTEIDDKVIDLLRRPIFGSVAIFGLSLATYQMGLGKSLEQATISVLQTLLILIWLRFAFALSGVILEGLSRNRNRFHFAQPDTLPMLRYVLVIFAFLAGTYSILVAWNINVTGLLASAGIVGLALSFAAQDTLSHLFAGAAILADRPYKLGDYIVLGTGERGEVTHIGLRSTRLLTRDDVEVTVPNGVIGGAKIVNESGGPYKKYRVRVAVGVSYGSDVDDVIDALASIAKGHEEVCTFPEPRVRFRTFGESGLDFELLCWISEPALRGKLLHELNCNVYKEFITRGITIPFPQRDLHIRAMPEGLTNSGAVDS
jgi:MscS family membrane protein